MWQGCSPATAFEGKSNVKFKDIIEKSAEGDKAV